MQAAESAVRKAAEPGRFIFIYNNVRTNQVIYSLSRTVQNTSALKQITFAGKKTVPSAVRKDMWRPFATVEFPTGLQGLDAYRKLREFRKVHEYCWADEERKNLPPKWERKKILMDQKANSVADLAAVLNIHERKSKEMAEVNARFNEQFWEEISQMAGKAESGILGKIEAQIEILQKAREGSQDKEKCRSITNSIRGLKVRRNNILFAQKLLQMRVSVEEVSQERETAAEQFENAYRTYDQVKRQLEEAGKAITPKGNEAGEIEAAREAWTRADEVHEAAITKEKETQKEYDELKGKLMPRLSESLRQDYRLTSKPAMSLDGVVVQWSNIEDSEYAEKWPNMVSHEIYNKFRHAAPKPEALVEEAISTPRTEEQEKPTSKTRRERSQRFQREKVKASNDKPGETASSKSFSLRNLVFGQSSQSPSGKS